MDTMLGYCGYRCDMCPAYEKKRTFNTDTQFISDKWFQYFGFRVPPDEINCVGCMNEGKHADSDCPVRPCAVEKGVESCAVCENFGCNRLKSRMNFIEDHIKDIDHIPENDYKLFIEPYLGKKRLLEIKSK